MPFPGECNAVSLAATGRFAIRESAAGLKPEKIYCQVREIVIERIRKIVVTTLYQPPKHAG